MPLRTPNDGAAQERSQIKREIVRVRAKVVSANVAATDKQSLTPFDEILTFIAGRAKRTGKHAGGLGRKQAK